MGSRDHMSIGVLTPRLAINHIIHIGGLLKMPIYEYHCKSCKKTFEEVQKISDDPLTECPSCGKRVKRLISSTSFTLKGEGWYKDGYAKGSSKHTESSKPADKKTHKDD